MAMVMKKQIHPSIFNTIPNAYLDMVLILRRGAILLRMSLSISKVELDLFGRQA